MLPPGFRRMLQYRLAWFSPYPKPAWNFGFKAVSICPSASQMFLPLILLFLYASLSFFFFKSDSIVLMGLGGDKIV